MREIYIRPSFLVIILVLLAIIIYAFNFSHKIASPLPNLQQKVEEKTTVDLTKFKNAKENEGCLKCHGQSKYTIEGKGSEKTMNKRMYSELVIPRNLFYNSNHREFKCTDCHSDEYNTFPHPGNLRLESKPNCIDCHGGDEKYAKFHFESIEKDFQESMHSQKHSEDFTCWMCHNPHTYKINARSNENIKETVIYDNNICLDCHSDYSRFGLLTDKQNPNILKKHEWLPNQQLHFQSVRCIECHALKMNDSTLVAHNIQPKNKAVKNCKECHSSKSELMASLYKYEAQNIRSASGFFRSIFTGSSNVIGASRNYSLTIISILLVAIALGGIIVHAILRTLKR
jgi:hypothetical protein